LFLIRTRCSNLSKENCQILFKDKNSVDVASQGPVVGMEWGGDNCINIISGMVSEHGLNGKLFVSPNDSEAARHLTTFFEQFKVKL